MNDFYCDEGSFHIDFTQGFTCIFNFGLHCAVGFRVEGNPCKVNGKGTGNLPPGHFLVFYRFFSYIVHLSLDNYCYCCVTIFLHSWSSRPQVTVKR